MLTCFTKSAEQSVITIFPIIESQFSDWLSSQNEKTKTWVASSGFAAKSGRFCLLPSSSGALTSVLFGVKDPDDFWAFGALANQLPEGIYQLDADFFKTPEDQFRASLAWGLGAYRFSKYIESSECEAKLLLDTSDSADHIENWVETICECRDWINTPAEDMTPVTLADIVKQLGKNYSAKVKMTAGDALLKANYHAIHRVGRASMHEPRLIDLRWGDRDAPKVALVGKGVCFDSGGLDIKPSVGMRIMKKDMGGAAHAIALARMIMQHKLPLQLRLLIPAVENAVGSRSYRPGDVIQTRAGISVEVEDTDAEGRLILCDALAEAVTEKPDYLIDFSTLTGSARIALGPDIPAFLSNNDALATQIMQASERERDLMWRLPMHQAYESYLKSEVADIASAGAGGAGAITAALFLKRFVPDDVPWVHFDMSAWNYEARPGRPKGAEVMALRAVYHFLKTLN